MSNMKALDTHAKQALTNALGDLLTGMVAVDQRPDIFENYHPIDQFLNVLTKHEPWRSHVRFIDLYGILSDFVKKYAIAEQPGVKVKVVDALSASRFSTFRDEILKYLMSLPRQYVLTVELPSMPKWGDGEIQLTNRLSIVERAPKAVGLRGLAGIAAGVNAAPVFARVSGMGYGAGRLDSTAVADAISHLKQCLHLLTRIESYKSEGFTLVLALSGPRVRCEVVDVQSPDDVMSLELPEQLRKFLWAFSIDSAKLKHYDRSAAKTLLGGEPRAATTRDEKVGALKLNSDWISRLMNCSSDWPDVERIRAAVEWSFDSGQNDNETLAFIQACIGLEALVGDDDKEEPLTARLADRCAYLLGKSHKDRVEIRKKFKDVYDVRSKLIHGRTSRLNLPDAEKLQFAQMLLSEVITTEANVLLHALAKAEAKK